MARTRAAVLRAAVQVVAERGIRRASMSDLAAAAGIAKGTLYNHFRTKDEVWSALVRAELDALIDECRGLPLELALGHAARRIGAHPAVRRLAVDEPAVLAALVTAALVGADRRRTLADAVLIARAAIAEALVAAGHDPVGTDLVLRWLVSHLLAPDTGAATASVGLLTGALSTAAVPG